MQLLIFQPQQISRNSSSSNPCVMAVCLHCILMSQHLIVIRKFLTYHIISKHLLMVSIYKMSPVFLIIFYVYSYPSQCYPVHLWDQRKWVSWCWAACYWPRLASPRSSNMLLWLRPVSCLLHKASNKFCISSCNIGEVPSGGGADNIAMSVLAFATSAFMLALFWFFLIIVQYFPWWKIDFEN